MPFNSENAALAGRKGGQRSKRKKDPNTRSKQLLVKVTDAEYDTITAKAKTYRISRAELIVRAVEKYEE